MDSFKSFPGRIECSDNDDDNDGEISFLHFKRHSPLKMLNLQFDRAATDTQHWTALRLLAPKHGRVGEWHLAYYPTPTSELNVDPNFFVEQYVNSSCECPQGIQCERTATCPLTLSLGYRKAVETEDQFEVCLLKVAKNEEQTLVRLIRAPSDSESFYIQFRNGLYLRTRRKKVTLSREPSAVKFRQMQDAIFNPDVVEHVTLHHSFFSDPLDVSTPFEVEYMEGGDDGETTAASATPPPLFVLFLCLLPIAVVSLYFWCRWRGLWRNTVVNN